MRALDRRARQTHARTHAHTHIHTHALTHSLTRTNDIQIWLLAGQASRCPGSRVHFHNPLKSLKFSLLAFPLSLAALIGNRQAHLHCVSLQSAHAMACTLQLRVRGPRSTGFAAPLLSSPAHLLTVLASWPASLNQRSRLRRRAVLTRCRGVRCAARPVPLASGEWFVGVVSAALKRLSQSPPARGCIPYHICPVLP